MVRSAVPLDDADQHAATRTAVGAVEAADQTRCSDGMPTATEGQGAADGALSSPSPGARSRLPAPLQYRDPGRYEILAEHGRGGLGRVMRARDRELGRPVAIKELLAPNHASELRFFREAMITARLEHPNIVPVHEAGRWPDGMPFYSMKLVAGRPLSALIEQVETTEQRLALVHHVLAVADAIAYAHSKGIIHRDLKPSNVIVGEFGETVVIDWGLAKEWSVPAEPHEREEGPVTSSASQITVAGSVLGTPAFMAPEQARGENASVSSDIYALGAVLLKVLTGRTTSHSGWTDSPRGAARLAELVSIARRALSPQPSDRYESAADFGEEIRRFQRGSQVKAHRYTALQRALRFLRSHRTVAASLGLACLTGTLLAIFFTGRLINERQRTLDANRQLGSAVTALEREQQGLVLQQVRSNVERDPTTAIAWLKHYRGADLLPAQQLAATAVASGVASATYRPPGSAIVRVVQVAHDPVLLAISQVDGTLSLWQRSSRVARLSDGLDERALVAADPRRAQLLYGTQAGKLLLYDHHSRTTQEISSYSPPLRSLELFRDGANAMAASADGTVLVVDLQARTSTHFPAGSRIHLAKPSQSGRFIFICTADGKAVLLTGDGSSQTPLGACSKQTTAPYAFSPDETVIAVASHNDVSAYRTNSGRPIQTWPVRHPGLAATVSARHFAVCSTHGHVLLLPFDGGAAHQVTQTLSRPTAIGAVLGGRVVVGLDDGDLLVFEADAAASPVLRRGHRQRVISVSAFPDGRTFVSADDREMRIMDVPSSRGWTLPVTATFNVVYSKDDSRLGFDSEDGTVFSIDRRAGTVTPHRAHTATTFGIQAFEDGFLTSSWDGTVRRWSAVGAVGAVVQGEGIARNFAVSKGTALTAFSSNTVMLADLSGGTASQRWRLPEAPYRVAAGEGVFLIVGLSGGVYWFGGSEFRLVGKHGDTASAVGYLPSLRLFATTGVDGMVKLWSADGTPRGEVKAGSRCRSMAASRTALLAVTCDRFAVRVIDASTGRVRFEREIEHEHYNVAFSSSANMLAVTTSSGKVYVWNLDDESLAVASVGASLVTSAAFSADGTELSVSTFSNQVSSYRLTDLRFVPRDLSSWVTTATDAETSHTTGQGTP